MSSQKLNSAGKRIVFGGKQQVALEIFQVPEPKEGEVMVKTHLSQMSTGTENIVFNRLFDPGTHWDEWVKYPFYPGYAAVGEVIAIGPGNTRFKVGDRVAYRSGHASHAVVPDANCSLILAGLSFDQAVWFALAKIAYHGVFAADLRLGENVLIIGAGPIGQMALRWANAAGAARITVVDSAEARLTLAVTGGATTVIGESIEKARGAVLDANDGRLPHVVIDSTGNSEVFAAALGLAADFGRVVILGDTGRPSQQKLTSDVIRRGLRVIGAHDAHELPNWSWSAIIQLFFQLAATGRFNLEGLNSHSFKPEDCAQAYEIANRDRAHTMGILFDWSGAGDSSVA